MYQYMKYLDYNTSLALHGVKFVNGITTSKQTKYARALNCEEIHKKN